MIPRILSEQLAKRMGDRKALVLLGPRQTGKTTLMEALVDSRDDVLRLDCDDPEVRGRLDTITLAGWRDLIGSTRIVFIDEAQRIPDIGVKLKLVTDRLKDVKLLVTGSSALELANDLNEPLTGRKWEYVLHPVAWKEWSDHVGAFEAERDMEQRLVLGMYPEVLTHPQDARELLRELAGSYLYRDLLGYKGIRKPELLEQLLRALALQLGSEVSLNELAQLLRVDKATVGSYIDLLEKAFIIFRLPPLKRNLRNEVATTRKVYFVDNGIRNAIIGNLDAFVLRTDQGALWENFLMAERRKWMAYSSPFTRMWFWRTAQQQEVDLVEEEGKQLRAFEFKLDPKAKGRIPTTFSKAYPTATAEVVHRGNFRKFLGA
ncbi:MAG: ATP-binding protein [Flavobacteriales bacterium]|nr:ATP-binding protein [Flavobacteriales bacterium]